MSVNINGTTGVSLVQDGVIVTADIVDANVTDGKIATMSSSKLTGALPAIDGSALTGLSGGVPSGTKQLFVQTAAPTGWTKDLTHNDKALRIVSGTASTGGSVAFTTAFASQAVNGTVATSGATTLSTSQIPSHTHTKTTNTTGSITTKVQIGGAATTNDAFTTDPTGGGGSHTHAAGAFTGTAINLAVQYVDIIIATKD